MKEPQRASLVNSILSGYTICYVDGIKFIVEEPSPQLLYESYDVYQQVLDKYKFADLLTKDDSLLFLVSQNLWTIDGDKNFKEIDKSIDNLKLQLFQTFYTDRRMHAKVAATLEKVKEKQSEMYQTRYRFDSMTTEGVAEYARQIHIYHQIIYDAAHKELWANTDQYDLYQLERIMYTHMAMSFDEHTFRELARTVPWVNYWTAYRNSLIPRSGARLESLIGFSKFYDSVRKNPECPEEEIVKLDDVLDGWLVLQGREADESKKAKSLQDIGSKKHDDIFIPARTKEDADNIYSRNAPEVRTRQKLRQNFIQAKGEVKDLDLPDVKREVAMKARRQSSAAMKGKR